MLYACTVLTSENYPAITGKSPLYKVRVMYWKAHSVLRAGVECLAKALPCPSSTYVHSATKWRKTNLELRLEETRAGIRGKEELNHDITSDYMTLHIYASLDEPLKIAAGEEEKGRGNVLKPGLAIPLMMQATKQNSVFSPTSKSAPFLCSPNCVLTERLGTTEAFISYIDVVEGTL